MKLPSEGTMNKSENDSEASISEYEVFLSFRGLDSRRGLPDVLYNDMNLAGFHVFRGDDELDIGDEISESLPAIEKSKVCVPIFSRTFAASTWCLREVERMAELKKSVIPIFYTASPDDVKLNTVLFKEDLRKHEAKHGADQVRKWENALKAVAQIKGLEVKSTGYAEFSKLLVKSLLIKLNVKKKYVTDFLVRRDNQEEALMKLLDIDANDVRLIGIHGLDGTGKTTLAKVNFNQLSARFDYCSFLEIIQESVRLDSPDCLPLQLLHDLDPKLKDIQKIDPIAMLRVRENFCNRKVLVVLDDVNDRKHIEMIVGVLDLFGPGSRMLMTARDRRVFPKEARALEVQEMNQDEAVQLFSRHSFGADSPPSDYKVLSDEVVHLTGRLPLALEVMGSLLHQREKKKWRTTIDKLKKVPNRDIQEKLRQSFDALEPRNKQIFLDIACFFSKKEMSSAVYMWEVCDFFPDEGMEALVSMSLVRTEGNNFWMQDLVRDLGRTLIRHECINDPAKRSRIWSHNEASEVLKMKQGKEKVEGLFLEEPFEVNLTNEEFASFRRLRLLKLVGTKLEGDFYHLLQELRWFSWQQCPHDFTATNLSLTNLLVLDLSRSLITERWIGWSLIQMAKNLKVVDLTECLNLISTPDLSNNEFLKKLILTGCRNLAEIHNSIFKLKKLKHLYLEGCYSLRGFPEGLGSWKIWK